MADNPSPLRIGIFGRDDNPENERHGCGLWPAGYASCLTAAGATPVFIPSFSGKAGLETAVEGLHGLVIADNEPFSGRQLLECEKLCEWCRRRNMPTLVIDTGLHVLNSVFGGTIYSDLPRELPEALQHRHPPEKGLRHAIEMVPGSRLAELYGEGEIVVNSEHRRAVQRIARGFRLSARALDGVTEAIEAEKEDWFCLGVQWHPASATASGLDIQLFRGLVDACQQVACELAAA